MISSKIFDRYSETFYSFGCYNIENFNAAPKVIGVLGANPSNGTQTVLWDFESTHPDQYRCPYLYRF
jgi:hypothetical protein